MERGYTLKGMNLLLGSKFVPCRVDPIEKGGTNENGRVASPESVSIHLEFGHNNRHNTSLKLSIQSRSYSYQMDIFL